jgi:hypothetical protein
MGDPQPFHVLGIISQPLAGVMLWYRNHTHPAVVILPDPGESVIGQPVT